MSKIVLLDSGPLGLLLHPGANAEIILWLDRVLSENIIVILPEITDYEVRRELLRMGKSKSIRHLDTLKQELDYLPLTTATMLKAAELWAAARWQGKPTSDDKALDGDMILCAQAALIGNAGDDVMIATNNLKHLAPFSQARLWQDI